MENQNTGPRRGNAADQDFPGYPHYNPEDDITAAGERVSASVEGVSRANNQTEATLRGAADGDNTGGASRPQSEAGLPANADNSGPKSSADREGEDPETDVTEEDIMLLDGAERGIDESDDAQAPLRAQLDETDDDGDPLNEASGREGFPGDDLDVPGSENDDGNENLGEEDEENNYYSLGSDEKTDLDDANEGSINRV